MSEGMIIRRGGGASLKATDALLRVQAPAGSTVTITKGTTTKTDLGHENILDPNFYDYYFVIHQSQFDSVNPWTVTATIGAQSTGGTIIIDQADEYDMNLAFEIVIFSADNMTGVDALTKITNGTTPTWNVDTANARWGAASASNSSVGGFLYYELLDLTSFTAMSLTYLNMAVNNYYGGQYGIYVMDKDTTPTLVTAAGATDVWWGAPQSYEATARFTKRDTTSESHSGTFTLDVSQFSGFHYVGFGFGRTSVGAGARSWGGYVTDWRLN